MYIEGRNELLTIREALDGKIDKLRMQISESTIPKADSLEYELHKTRMKQLEISIELHQRTTIELDRINYQNQKRS